MTDYFHLHAPPGALDGLSSLGLAHLGDAVFELMVRSWLCLGGKATNRGLHKAAVQYVSATAQAKLVRRVMACLTPEELDVFRRGRNANPHCIPHAASREEYAAATGLEALFGWLYLQGSNDRLNQLFETMMEEDHGT